MSDAVVDNVSEIFDPAAWKPVLGFADPVHVQGRDLRCPRRR